MPRNILIALTGLGLLGSATFVRSRQPVPPAPRIEWHGTMLEARAAHQASLLPDRTVLVSGGCRGPGCRAILASAAVFDPDTRRFQAVNAMHTPRASHVAVGLEDGRVLVAGGWSGSEATATAEVYDPAVRRFTQVGSMGEPRESPSAVRLSDGRVLIVGGTTAEMFDPATSTFSRVGDLRRIAPILVSLPDGRVLVTGGDGPGGEVLRTAMLFDPTTHRFTPTGDMTVPRHKHGAARLPDGRVIVVGGSDSRDARGLYASTEFYDPGSGTFSPGPSLRTARHKIQDAVVALASGAVLVAGGAATPELWDPADNVFVPVDGTLGGLQMFATGTPIGEDHVLVLGGYDERIRPAASAWLIRH